METASDDRGVLFVAGECVVIAHPDFSYCYPAKLGKAVARRYLIRDAGKGMLLFLAIAAYGIVNLAYGSAHWLFGSLAAAGLGYNFVWIKNYWDVLQLCDERAGKLVRINLSDTAMDMEVEHLKVSIGWPAFTECWRMPDALAMFTARNRSTYVLLPFFAMTDEQRAFIQGKLLEHKVPMG